MQPNQPNQPTAPGMPAQPGVAPVAPSQPSAMPGADPLVAGGAQGANPAPTAMSGATAPMTAGAMKTPGAMPMQGPGTGMPAAMDAASLMDAELNKPVENKVEPVPQMEMPKPKKVNAWMIGTIAAAAVAVFGIIFGVMMLTQKNSSETSLNKQIKSLKEQVSALQNAEPETPEVPEVDTADYVYVGEWGLKIAVPATSYAFSNNELKITSDAGEATVIRVDTGTAGLVVDTSTCETTCYAYVATVGEYDYGVLVTGEGSQSLSEIMMDSANYSLIYAVEQPAE